MTFYFFLIFISDPTISSVSLKIYAGLNFIFHGPQFADPVLEDFLIT